MTADFEWTDRNIKTLLFVYFLSLLFFISYDSEERPIKFLEFILLIGSS